MADFVIRSGPVRIVGTDTGRGPSVLLLHAGAERRSVWTPIATSLTSRGYRCVAIDQRGHGESGSTDGDRLPDLVTDALATIRMLGGPVVLVGASLGGLVAILAAAAVPARIAGMVLVDVVPTLDPARVRPFLRQLPRPDRVRWPLVEDILARLDELAVAARSLRLPTLLVTGDRGAVGVDELRHWFAIVPYADMVTVGDAGHLVARDAPLPLADVLAGFLARPAVAVRHAPEGNAASRA